MKNILIILTLIISLTSCQKNLIPESDKDQIAIYDEFWNHVNENYIYFEQKGVDWNAVYNKYISNLNPESSDEDLLQAIEQSLIELKDSHNYISSPIRFGEKYNYRDGHEFYFDLDVVNEQYISGDLKEQKIFSYGNINETCFYVHVPEMEEIFSLRSLIRKQITEDTKNIIIDLRGNTGGDSDPVPSLIGDYISEKTFLGSYIEKTGPARSDVTDPINIFAEPNPDIHLDQKVYLLIDRKGFSATSYMAAMCKGVENFTLVGQPTGGGGGGNAAYELSNGWIVAVSVSDFTDKEDRSIELGVEPDILVNNTASDIESGRDIMLEKVLELTK